ncbi:unnamed protein product [Lampetra planeri]
MLPCFSSQRCFSSLNWLVTTSCASAAFDTQTTLAQSPLPRCDSPFRCAPGNDALQGARGRPYLGLSPGRGGARIDPVYRVVYDLARRWGAERGLTLGTTLHKGRVRQQRTVQQQDHVVRSPSRTDHLGQDPRALGCIPACRRHPRAGCT